MVYRRETPEEISYKELCADCKMTFPKRRTGRILYKTVWMKGSKNDTLIAYIIKKGYPYLRSFNGDIWSRNEKGEWFTVEFEIVGNLLYAYEVK